MNGVRAHIVMPENAPVVKKNAVAGYGAEITFVKPWPPREETTRLIMERTVQQLIHPYDNVNVICGQGNGCSLEMLEGKGDLEIVIAPWGWRTDERPVMA